ncbi:hypothetical protein [Burkholderia gladioli]|uniref:hypothetical protein n=1 Tax=Burkholderia gladioli TaxID=28095 RepID=UPI0016405628|nr:hypothetical protein [Burkholderia gladioli]
MKWLAVLNELPERLAQNYVKACMLEGPVVYKRIGNKPCSAAWVCTRLLNLATCCAAQTLDFRAILAVGLFHGPGFERLPGRYKSGQFADVLDTGT